MRPTSSLAALLICANSTFAGDAVVLDPGRHPAPGFVARPAPDGKTVVTLGTDRCVRVWDTSSGKALRELWLPEHAGDQFWLAPDGKTVAVPFYTSEEPRGKLALIPLDDSGKYRVIGGSVFQVEHVAFSPNGKQVATACKWPPVSVWEVATGKKVCDIEHDNDLRPSGMTFNADGTKLVVSLPMVNFNELKRSSVITYDAATGKELSAIRQADNRGGDFGRPMWAPNGKTLALVRDVIELRGADGKFRETIRAPKAGVVPVRPVAAAYDDDGRLLVAWPDGDEFKIRNEADGTDLTRLKLGDGRKFHSLGFSAEGHLLVVDTQYFVLFDMARKAFSRETRAATRVPTALAWGKGSVLAWGDCERKDPKDNIELVAALDLSDFTSPSVNGAEFTRRRTEWGGVKLADTGYSATATANGKAVKLDYEVEFDFEDIKTITLVGPDHAILSTAKGLFSYDTKTGKQLVSYGGSGAWVLAPSPDGKFFAVATGWTPLIHVHKLTSSEPVLTLYVDGGAWVAWTPSGAWASSPGAEKWAGTLTKPAAGKLPTFVPFDPKKRDPDKVKAALK